MDLKLGINLGFAVNRYPEPEVWTRIVGEELGLKYVQLVADLINVFLPEEIVAEQTELIREYTNRYGIQVTSSFTSSFTRVNHFMHPDVKQRKVWLEWFKRFARVSASLGARTMGSHFGILSFHDYDNPERREYIINEGLKNWRELSWFCKELGMEFMIFEPMSVPREMANTVGETRELLEKLNDGAGIPFKVCLDIGHAPHPSERDPYPWMKELGSVSPIIHIQQTELNHSRHWPFTPDCNRTGIIHPERVLATLEASGAKEAELLFEISHREAWPTDFQVIADLKASVEYWRPYIKD